ATTTLSLGIRCFSWIDRVRPASPPPMIMTSAFFGAYDPLLLAFISRFLPGVEATFVTEHERGAKKPLLRAREDPGGPAPALGCGLVGDVVVFRAGTGYRGGRAVTPDELLGRLLVDIAIVVVVARLFAVALRKVHEPPVMAEILAGIALGPTIL